MLDPTDPDADPRAVIVAGRTIAMDRLAARDRSRGELLDALARRRFPEDIAVGIVDQLQSEGLVDDERFARTWVEQRSRAKGLARSVLRMELQRKGVSAEIIDVVLQDVDPDTERQAAHQLVQRKLRSVQGLDPSVQLRRLTAMLARKGYAPQVAFDVVRTELDAEADPIESI
ncbi:regulatory protein RecX [Aeromicrobium duanguangcaii]|uniref:regulatory protein RecX n=1 Tax=Aeromicrobium duanguangcaii TaxID=2968086 RepID=UPI002016ACA8|nr:regulatory protein RecX [Aeromicrobium duanguangcaii]MCL3837408.1 recombination regulator RecX [Aeromicrobium duanguangcaii]